MIRSRRTALLLASTVLSLACPGAEPPRAGVVVQYLAPAGAAARGGLRVGDRLLFYRRQAAPPANPLAKGGQLLSCADLAEIEVEEKPRGPVELEIERGGRRLAVRPLSGDWQVAAVNPAGDSGCTDFAAAREAADAHSAEIAIAAYQRAAQWAQWARRPLFRALVLEKAGIALLSRNDFKAAEGRFDEALAIRRKLAPGSLAEASSWHALGRLERMRGAYELADQHLKRALDLRQRQAPDSLERAFTINNLGIVSAAQGRLEEAEKAYLEALELVRRSAPESLEEAQILNNLGLLQKVLGHLAMADAYFQATYRIDLRLDPQGPDMANLVTNLGTVAYARGNFALAERYHQEAIDRFKTLAPNGLEIATGYFNLGLIAGMRQDVQGAARLLQQSLAIRHRLAPNTLIEAQALSALADNAQALHDYVTAERLGERAFALRSRFAPDGEDTSISLGILARIALRRGDFARATGLAQRELERQTRLGDGSLSQTHSLSLLGEIYDMQGKLEEARRYYERTVAIRRTLQPTSADTADALDDLGLLERKCGNRRAAEAAFRAAIDAIEGQVRELGGTDEQLSNFESSYLSMYQNLLDVQLERGDLAGAVATLERSRARGLLTLLAQRDLVFSSDVPARLRAKQEDLDRDYARVQRDVAGLDPKRKREINRYRIELDRLGGRRAALASEIARASPRYAALSNPRPLELAEIRRTLDPGTVWLAYSLGEKSHLLLVDKREVRDFPIAADRATIAREVGIFRSLLLRGATSEKVETALLEQGARLYQLLVQPAEPWIAKADRLLISPDGALHALPFGALVRSREPLSYLVEWKPLHAVLSATLFAELKARRPGPRGGDGTIAIFADPAYPRPRGATNADESPQRRYRQGLPILPAGRAEGQALAALYSPAALLYTGVSASERQAKNLPGGVRIVHFASHALLDRHFPLDSALALAAPHGGDQDDGLLQAWEIFERVRLDADLVTLSACETGLGNDGGGDGLIGLTRAFQYAGARSILASLWSVSDRSTAELMKRFYSGLRAGLPKDRALYEAQKQLWRDTKLGLTHPYHWASFEMIGDWR